MKEPGATVRLSEDIGLRRLALYEEKPFDEDKAELGSGRERCGSR